MGVEHIGKLFAQLFRESNPFAEEMWRIMDT